MSSKTLEQISVPHHSNPARGGVGEDSISKPAGSDFPFVQHRWSWSADGTELAYYDEGLRDSAGQQPTILLLHGSPMSSYMWRRVIARLRSFYRIVAVDLPGFGASRSPLVPGRAFSKGAQILAKFVRDLDLKNLVLVSHATAGPMGLGAALCCPDRISALVISNSFGWAIRQSGNPVGRMARLVSSTCFSWLIVRSGLLGWATTRRSRRVGRYSIHESVAIAKPLREPSVRLHLINVLRSIRGDEEFLTRLAPRLRRDLAQTPTLLLFGAHDNGYQAGFVDHWKSIFEKSESSVLPHSGHFLLEDEPDAWIDAVSDFLESALSPKAEG